jgi:transcriptional regulator with XRE-family HTH domain
MSKLTYNRIKGLLANAGKTNLELAEYLGVHEQTVSGWCRNKNQPEYDTLFKISDFFGMEAGELLTLKRDLKPVRKAKEKPAKKVTPKRK